MSRNIVSRRQFLYLLHTYPKFLEYVLMNVYQRQTAVEKSRKDTEEDNNVGFNKPDAKILSYCATWVISGKHVSGKYVEVCQHKLSKYWRQLLGKPIPKLD